MRWTTWLSAALVQKLAGAARRAEMSAEPAEILANDAALRVAGTGMSARLFPAD